MPVGGRDRHGREYVRNGTANLFIALERSGNGRLPRDPLAGWRHVEVSDARARADFARFAKELVGGRYKGAEKIVRVMDPLNTPGVASLYQAFAPAEARRIAQKLETHHTPRHGSWLDMAEVELGVLARQRLDRRIEDRATLAREVAAWEVDRNARAVKADWQSTAADARIKLRKLYPTIDGWQTTSRSSAVN